MVNSFGTNGDDLITPDAVSDGVTGGPPGATDDRIEAYGGDDTVKGGSGTDALFGGDGDDTVFGNGGGDHVDGGSGNDKMWGNHGKDILTGGTGNDTVNGGERDDVLHGGAGRDRLWGQKHDDTLFGEDGNDRLWGSWGRDSLDGGAGRDTLKGGENEDTLSGGSGDDILFGGGGGDRFEFSAAFGTDTIKDFENGLDRLALGAYAIGSFEDLRGHIAEADGDTTIDLTPWGGGTIVLDGVGKAALSGGDFTILADGVEMPMPDAGMVPGAVSGVWIGSLPVTPNGLVPNQSWNAVASDPDGGIYVAGMDHVTNSALYRVADHGNGLGIWYLGDANSASEAAGNWLPDETAEKFHVQPTWHDGKVYVATTDSSEVGDEYLNKRGFHWYAYDTHAETFTDLSATETEPDASPPDGVGAPHVQIMAISIDADRDFIYGLGTPTGDLYRYDIATEVTVDLGRPEQWDRDTLSVGRVLWLDSDGRVYFAAGHFGESQGAPYDPSIYGHVYSFDPATGDFDDHPDWALAPVVSGETVGSIGPNAARHFPGLDTTYLTDRLGNVYAFTDADDGEPDFTLIGSFGDIGGKMFSAHVTDDASTIYAFVSRTGTTESALLAYDIATGGTRWIADVSTLDPRLHSHRLTGMNAWDNEGRFYATAFSSGTVDPTVPALLFAIDPDQLMDSLFTDDLWG